MTQSLVGSETQAGRAYLSPGLRRARNALGIVFCAERNALDHGYSKGRCQLLGEGIGTFISDDVVVCSMAPEYGCLGSMF